PLSTTLQLVAAYLPYQWLLGYAALRAAWRQALRVNTWEKTQHVGAHRTVVPAVPGAMQQAAAALETEMMHRG
ncbi:MAG: hypothetical protein M3154_06825, partial [Candidatus Eremiobacteraeota bacterium]|nr:hypothetical protein [Candidatus Eremiobacteraeota bacterium]